MGKTWTRPNDEQGEMMKYDNTIYDLIHGLDVSDEERSLIIDELKNNPSYLDKLISFVYPGGEKS